MRKRAIVHILVSILALLGLALTAEYLAAKNEQTYYNNHQ